MQRLMVLNTLDNASGQTPVGRSSQAPKWRSNAFPGWLWNPLSVPCWVAHGWSGAWGPMDYWAT